MMPEDAARRLTREQLLRHRMLDRFGSLRQFAKAANLPYSSVLTLLSHGIGGASFDTVMQICRTLELDPASLTENP